MARFVGSDIKSSSEGPIRRDIAVNEKWQFMSSLSHQVLEKSESLFNYRKDLQVNFSTSNHSKTKIR